MRYLTSPELQDFHDSFLRALRKHSSGHSDEAWGFPHGWDECDTFSFRTVHGTLLIGHLDLTKELGRWWIPISLEDNYPNIEFEINIPLEPNLRLSVHYTMDDDGAILILHKGRFTVVHAIGMSEFFEYYRANPVIWERMQYNWYDYLILAKIEPESVDSDFLKIIIPSLADFAHYIHNFKTGIRD